MPLPERLRFHKILHPFEGVDGLSAGDDFPEGKIRSVRNSVGGSVDVIHLHSEGASPSVSPGDVINGRVVKEAYLDDGMEQTDESDKYGITVELGDKVVSQPDVSPRSPQHKHRDIF